MHHLAQLLAAGDLAAYEPRHQAKGVHRGARGYVARHRPIAGQFSTADEADVQQALANVASPAPSLHTVRAAHDYVGGWAR